jgi:8-hydroxy-5-deazaflavin:NADPH oxidoreductase
MSYAIIGFGAEGQALARAFARKNIEVAVASRRPPGALAPQARAIGPTVVPKGLQDAIKADTIILAVPFWEHRQVAKALASWQGKTVIDATNAFGVPVEDLDGLPSSAVIAKAFPGAKFVKVLTTWPRASWPPTRTSRAGAGSCSCRATTKARRAWWRPWPNNSASPRSS